MVLWNPLFVYIESRTYEKVIVTNKKYDTVVELGHPHYTIVFSYFTLLHV